MEDSSTGTSLPAAIVSSAEVVDQEERIMHFLAFAAAARFPPALFVFSSDQKRGIKREQGRKKNKNKGN